MDKISGSLSPLSASVSGDLIIKRTADFYHGSYEVTPKAYTEQVLETAQKLMAHDVTVFQVPYYETSNVSGTTVYIAKEV